MMIFSCACIINDSVVARMPDCVRLHIADGSFVRAETCQSGDSDGSGNPTLVNVKSVQKYSNYIPRMKCYNDLVEWWAFTACVFFFRLLFLEMFSLFSFIQTVGVIIFHSHKSINVVLCAESNIGLSCLEAISLIQDAESHFYLYKSHMYTCKLNCNMEWNLHPSKQNNFEFFLKIDFQSAVFMKRFIQNPSNLEIAHLLSHIEPWTQKSNESETHT